MDGTRRGPASTGCSRCSRSDQRRPITRSATHLTSVGWDRDRRSRSTRRRPSTRHPPAGHTARRHPRASGRAGSARAGRAGAHARPCASRGRRLWSEKSSPTDSGTPTSSERSSSCGPSRPTSILRTRPSRSTASTTSPRIAPPAPSASRRRSPVWSSWVSPRTTLPPPSTRCSCIPCSRAPDRGLAPVDPRQARRGRPSHRTADDRERRACRHSHRSPHRRTPRHDLADRRASTRETRSRRRGPIHPVLPRRDAGGGGAGTPRRHRRSPSLPRFPARCRSPAGALRVVGRR